jgi:NAD+ synthase (glutamine-hydrolysing)
VKIALAQINYHIGNFRRNAEKIIIAIRKAKQQGADLIVFAELAVSGYPPRDFLEFNHFIEKCNDSLKLLAKEANGIGVIIGSPSKNPAYKGKDLFNSAYLLADGEIKEVRHKTLLPNYDIFDEYRYFEPNNVFDIIEYEGKRIALTICEDLWNVSDHPLYTVNPMEELLKQSPDLIINISASPFHYSKAINRKKVLVKNVKRYQIPLFYVNHVGAQTELLFDGGSLVINRNGDVISELNYFQEDFRIFSLDDVENINISGKQNRKYNKIELIHDALIMGIENYFGKLGFEKAILGLSGGIDSAITLVLATKALGYANVRSVLMPSQFSSEHSITDAEKLAENLGSPYDIIPIQDAVKSMDGTMHKYFEGMIFDLTEENIQARLRGVILMALSNKFGYILLNTSNKSEAAVGYSTLYGDMNGGLSVIGDIYKTEVFDLARYINRNEEIIPENIIIKPPSAELRPDQKDSDSLPDYAILDKILFLYIEKRKGPNEIVDMGFPEEIVNKTLKLVNTNEYKRYQTPPTLRVSQKAFGMGRRMPIVAKYLS